MLPFEVNNYDIVVGNNISPSVQYVFNLGQDNRRWKNVYSDWVVCSDIVFNTPRAGGAGFRLTEKVLKSYEDRIVSSADSLSFLTKRLDFTDNGALLLEDAVYVQIENRLGAIEL